MGNWKKKLENALRSVKFCFPCVDGKYPELDEDEFVGGEQGGFLHYMQSLVYEMRKEAFFRGYRHGAVDTFEDLQGNLVDGTSFVMTDSTPNGAWDRWQEETREG